jgi:tetratricopeptide (TPR) repeat protein
VGERTVYLETLNPWVDNGWAPLYAARSHGRKYVLAPAPELYDLSADPAESRNLLSGGGEAGEVMAEAEALRAFLDRRLPGGPMAELAEDGAPAGPGETDPEVRRRLEALGYLSGGSSGGGDRSAPYGELPDPKQMLPLLDELSAGRSHLAGGRPEEAERSARRVLAASPRDRSALQLLAESYATRGRAEEAERALRRSLEIGPTLGACVLLAQVVLQRGGPARADEAEALLDLAAESDPRHGAVLLARGDLALVRGRPAEAIARYEEAAEADPYRFAGLARARIDRLEDHR